MDGFSAYFPYSLYSYTLSARTMKNRPLKIAANAYLLKTRYFGDLLFGCPPDIVKALLKEKSVSNTCVLTLRTLRKGRNMIDVEFLLYLAMFFVKSKSKLNLICTAEQRRRVRTILKESLFCPSPRQLMRSLLPPGCLIERRRPKRLPRLPGAAPDVDEHKALDVLSDRLEDSAQLKKAFDEAMAGHHSEKGVVSAVLPLFKRIPGIRRGKTRSVAAAWVKSALIRRETRFFSPEPGTPDQILARHIEFRVFDKRGKAVLRNGDRRLIITQPEPCLFHVRRTRRSPLEVDLRGEELPEVAGRQQKKPFSPPELGVTFVGAGSGFAVERLTTCTIAWAGGHGICVDMVAEATRHIRRSGISPRDVRHVILTHTHGDHDSGLIQRIMLAEKIHLMTSRVIFDSFLRKAEAITRIPRDDLRRLVHFVELVPGREVRVPDIPHARVLFDYSFHSIPCGRVMISYGKPGKRRRKLFFSGDTLFDLELFARLREKGVITPERERSLAEMGWDADMIVHEAGGKGIHTEIEKLAALPLKVRRKIWLNHLATTSTRVRMGMRCAREGHTVVLSGGAPALDEQHCVGALRMTGLFRKLSKDTLGTLLREGRILRKRAGSVIVKEGTTGHEFFVILRGLAEIQKNGMLVNRYERGDFFGELAILTPDHTRRATIRAKTDVDLFVMSRELYEKYELPRTLEQNLYSVVNFFTEHNTSSLLGSLAHGTVAQFTRGDDIILVGARDKTVYILLSGSVDVLDAHDRKLATIKDVDIFGEIAALQGVRRTSTVRASENVKVLKLDEAQFRRIIAKFPSFYATIAQKAAKRLSAPETLRQVMRNEFGFH